jgi:hypothetical protein
MLRLELQCPHLSLGQQNTLGGLVAIDPKPPADLSLRRYQIEPVAIGNKENPLSITGSL